MNNTHRTKRAVDKATAFAKWCGKDLKYPALLFLLMTVSSMFMFRDYLFGDQLMIFNDIGSDTWQQYIMNYTAIVNDIRDGSFSLWDFSNGLGVNLFNFNLFDPFLMLLYGLGVILGPAHMLLFINVIQIIKMLAAGLVFYWLLSQFSFSPRAKLAAAYAIADLITDDDRSEENIIPGAFDPRVAQAVADAVAQAARDTGVARL